MLQDLRYSVRVLARAPGFTAIAATALALGIGATTAIFSLVYSILLRPLPFRDPGRLVAVWEKSRQKIEDRTFVSPANFLDWKEQSTSFAGMAAVMDTELNLTGGDGEPEELPAARVVPGLFELLGVRPAVGRVFRPGEDHERVVLLGDGLWKRRFGGSPAAVGRSIGLNGQSWTVVGVLPPDFQLINRQVEVFIPLPMQPAATYRATGTRNLAVFARLKPGVALRQAQAELELVAARLEQDYPRLNSGWTVFILPLGEELVGDVRRGLSAMFAAVGFLLLIACANVANLLLARASNRQREVALRAAVGASPGRIVRLLLAESLLLAACGGLLGVFLAWAGLKLFAAIGPRDLPRLDYVSINPVVLAFTLAAVIFTGVLFGMAPVAALARPNLAEYLKEGGRGSSAGRLLASLRNMLVGTEVALAAVLLVGAGLMARSFVRLRAVDPGLAPDKLLTMRVLLPQRAANPAERVVFFRQVLERIRAVPGVRSAGAVNFLPLTGYGAAATFSVEGRPVPPIAEKPTALVRAVDPDYFGAAGIPLLRGRAFTERDAAESPKVIVVSKTLARRFWQPGEPVVGARIALDSRQPYTAEIVGVAGDVYSEGLFEEPWAMIYCPHPQLPSTWMSLVVRTAPDPASLVSAVTHEIHVLRADLPVSDIRSMEQVLAESFATRRFTTMWMGVFSALALLLASVGVYGVISYNVAERSHEIGIRMALGAQRGDIFRLVVGRALLLALAGIAGGLTAAWALTRMFSSLLYGMAAPDPAAFIAVPLLLAGVATLAGYVPARRAMRLDPNAALRHE